MKKLLLTLFLAIATCGMAAVAATKYEINVGGIEVTSSNCNNVTGGNISITTGCSEGYVKYNERDNELELYNITIKRTGSGSYGVHNRKCDNLTITLMGQTNINCEAEAMMLQRNTRINVLFGTHYLTTTRNDKSAINASGINLQFFTEYYHSPSKMYITNTSSTKSTIGGDQSAVINFNFMKGNNQYDHKPHINIINYAGYALMNHTVNFNEGCDIHINNNSNNYQGIYNCTISTEGRVAILTPYGGYKSNGTIVTNTGSAAKEVYISDDYLAIINSTYFPDPKFRNYLVNTAGYSKGYLMQSDVDERFYFNDLYSRDIYSLKGIEYFTKLKTLKCNNNHLTSLDLSENDYLQEVDCSYNQLTSLEISNYGSIAKILCGNNSFTELTIRFHDHNLKTLDVSNCPYLTELYCYQNILTSLNVSNCTALKNLNCQGNNLTSLDVSTLKNLTSLSCYFNKLTSLDLSNNTKLTYLSAGGNQLTSLSLQNCTAINHVGLSRNLINNSNMTAFINSLRTIPTSEDLGELYIYATDASDEGNTVTQEHVKMARSKRWKPLWLVNDQWVEIPILGDVNGDGKINVSDVSALINIILDFTPKDPERADINGDGRVNVSDVTALINIILGV